MKDIEKRAEKRGMDEESERVKRKDGKEERRRREDRGRNGRAIKE